MIHSFDIPHEMSIALIRAVKEIGAYPYSQLQNSRVDRNACTNVSKNQLEASLAWELERMKSMDAYIAIRGSDNVFENSDIPSDDMKLAVKPLKPVLDWRVQKTKWCDSPLAYSSYGPTSKNEYRIISKLLFRCLLHGLCEDDRRNGQFAEKNAKCRTGKNRRTSN